MNQSNATDGFAELEVDVLQYVQAVLDNIFLIIAVALACGAAVYAYSLTMEDTYESSIIFNALDSGDPGDIRPDERRAPEVLTLVEHGFVMGSSRENYLYVLLRKMRSRQFTLGFMQKHGIFQAIFPQAWDRTTATWRPGMESLEIDAFKMFAEDIRILERDTETGIVTLRIRWRDPRLARDWANAYVTDFNEYIRAKTLAEVSRTQNFLTAELARSDIVELQQSIYRLIEAQTAVAMLANARDEFVLEVIDPAIIAVDRYSPARKRMTFFGLILGGTLTVAAVIARVMLQRFLAVLATARAAAPLRASEPQNRGVAPG